MEPTEQRLRAVRKLVFNRRKSVSNRAKISSQLIVPLKIFSTEKRIPIF
jgi:hypothetical protein